jgi:hypothetical protein
MCKECGKIFKTAQNLKIHSFVHIDLTLIEFKVGDKPLITYSKINSQIHTATKPFEFVECEAHTKKKK